MTMKRTAIAVAISAIIAPVAVQANELTIYGEVGAAVESLDNDTTGSIEEVSNNNSVLGFEGAIDLANGVKGVFHYDVFVDIDGDNGSLFGGGRDGWVGLKGESWGTVALGFQGRPWKTSTNHLDLFEGTIADYSAIMGNTGQAAAGGGGEYFDEGIGSSIIWFAPNVNGISGHVQYGADENDDNSNDWGAQINYSNGPLYLSLSSDTAGKASPADEVTATKVAGSYTFAGSTTVTAMYEIIKDSDVNTRNAWYLGGKHMLNDTIAIKAAYAAADENDLTKDSGASYWALGVSYMMDDNLEIFGLYSVVANDDAGAYGFVNDPSTSSNGNTSITAGDDSSVIAVGVKYRFSAKVM